MVLQLCCVPSCTDSLRLAGAQPGMTIPSLRNEPGKGGGGGNHTHFKFVCTNLVAKGQSSDVRPTAQVRQCPVAQLGVKSGASSLEPKTHLARPGVTLLGWYPSLNQKKETKLFGLDLKNRHTHFFTPMPWHPPPREPRPGHGLARARWDGHPPHPGRGRAPAGDVPASAS